MFVLLNNYLSWKLGDVLVGRYNVFKDRLKNRLLFYIIDIWRSMVGLISYHWTTQSRVYSSILALIMTDCVLGYPRESTTEESRSVRTPLSFTTGSEELQGNESKSADIIGCVCRLQIFHTWFWLKIVSNVSTLYIKAILINRRDHIEILVEASIIVLYNFYLNNKDILLCLTLSPGQRV